MGWIGFSKERNIPSAKTLNNGEERDKSPNHIWDDLEKSSPQSSVDKVSHFAVLTGANKDRENDDVANDRFASMVPN